MTAVARKIEQEIRELPLDDLIVLHEHLTASIHEKEDDEKLDPAFREEIQRRIDQINSGEAQGMDAFQALGEM